MPTPFDTGALPRLGAVSTIVGSLRAWAEAKPDLPLFTFLSEEGEEELSLTCRGLDTRARALGAFLRLLGLEKERVILLFPPGPDYIVAFLGCLYGGVIAVTAYPPRSSRGAERLRSIFADAAPRAVLATAAIRSRFEPELVAAGIAGAMPWIVPDADVPQDLAGSWTPPALRPDDLAFLQYTSGSTSAPRGVMVTHDNLLSNEELIRDAFGQHEGSMIVGWLPMYHDMGLIGNVLQPLFLGARCVLMSPLSFLQRPRRWLAAISRYRATTSGGPNFAYDLCVAKIPPAEREGLDLSCWEVAFNGAEPVRAATLKRFAEAFAPAGFRRSAFLPCYGLAEATLLVSGSRREPGILRLAAADLERNGVREAAPEEPGRELVGCGEPRQSVVVVDPKSGAPCPPDRVGELWVSGSGVAGGYWLREEETAATFGARLPGEEEPFLRTGDLGFVRDGEVFVTGRLKDLIIFRGRNHYPQDLELAAERSHPGLRPGGGAAFSLEGEGENRVGVVHEVDRHVRGDLEPLARAIRHALLREHELPVHEVVLIRQGSLPKTTSGKVQRRLCRRLLEKGGLEILLRSHAAAPAPETEPETRPAEMLRVLTGRERRAAARIVLAEETERVLGSPLREDEGEAGLLGLDSLMAVELRNRVEQRLGVTLSLVALLQETTLEQLFAEVEEKLEAELAGGAGAPGLPSEGRRADLPLSSGQRGLWFLHRLAPESTAYHLAVAARLRGAGEDDLERLAGALQVLVDRHDALRATFPATAEGPVQRIAPHLELAIPEIVTDAPLAEALDEVAHHPFDLAAGPLVRAALIRRPEERVLVLAAHHLVADFRSLQVLAGELRALLSGGELTLEAPQIGDFVAWQEAWLAGPESERCWRFWSECLAGGPPLLDLPADRPRPAVQTWVGGAVSRTLGAGVAPGLAAAGRGTFHSAVLAGTAAWLSILTGQEGLVLGVPAAGRLSRSLDGVVGYLANPLPVRLDAGKDQSFRELVARAHRAAAEALEHQGFPFPLLAERLHPERDPGRSPLFQAMVVLHQSRQDGQEGLAALALGEEGGSLALGGVELEAVAVPQRGAQLDLSVALAEIGGALRLRLIYNSGLFDEATAERFADQLATVLESAAAHPLAHLSAVELLRGPERQQVLVDWNRTAALYPEPRGLYRLFARQAEETPEAPAVLDREETVTYAGLALRVARLARWLISRGVGPETPVAVCAGRSADLVAALLGVLAAGGAYVPLDPAYPRERLRLILEDSGAPVLLAEERFLDRLPERGAGRVLLSDWRSLEETGEVAALPAVHPEQLAYYIYTSGSTGRPKAVGIRHRGVAAFLAWARGAFRPEELAAVFLGTSVCFDLSVFEVFAPLSTGGAVIVGENALDLAVHPLRGRVTLLNTVPSAAAELVRLGGVPPSVRTVCLAGEMLPASLVAELYALPHVERVLNLYGPSEDTTYSTVSVAERPEGAALRQPDIGRPLDNTRVYLLDRRGRPVPRGAVGELYLAGHGLARGYLGRPELTAERFSPDPFSGEPGGRLYATGDLARYRPDGRIELLGRADHQVKIRGFRIELGEIEEALARHPRVRQAAVIARGEGPGRQSLVAYVAGPAAPPAGELREALTERLPAFMVPAAFVILPALPLTPNGKVDRKALLESPGEEGGAGWVAPRDGMEAMLAEIFAEVLEGAVGVHDDFFARGGHSLLAARAAARIGRALAVELPVSALFAARTVAKLAALLGRERGLARPRLGELPAPPEAPLSSAQRRFLFLRQLDPESAAYHMPFRLRWRGPLDALALERALAAIARRHQVLRTGFAAGALGWEPVLHAAVPEIPRVDLRGLPAGRREAEAEAVARQAAVLPFDLARPPLRFLLLELGAEEHDLVAVLHHILADGWSLDVLGRELTALYAELAAGGAGDPGPLPAQYADFARWQQACLAAGLWDGQLAYWRHRLGGGLPVLELPMDRPRPASRRQRGGRLAARLPQDLTESLVALARREGQTLFMTLLAGFGALLHRVSRQREVVVGTPVANRPLPELEGLIGCFVNTVALRLLAAPDLAFHGLLEQVKALSLEAFDHQDLPFERLVDELHPGRSLSHSPLYQTMLVFQDRARPPLAAPGLEVAAEPLPTGTAKLDLLLELERVDGALTAGFEYDLELFDPVTVQRLAGQFEALLAGAAAAPTLALGDLDLLTEGERHQVRVEWNDAGRGYPRDLLLHGLFERQAALTPEAPAVEFAGAVLSYAELDRRAGLLARRLAGLGMRPDTPVGIAAERSLELMVGLLGILKTGGAYLPLDPSYPPERLAHLMAEARPAAVVAQHAGLVAWLDGGPPVVNLQSDEEELAGRAPAPGDPAALAYVLYTSGSTGRPKGVGIPHQGIVNRLLWMQEMYGLGPEDRVLQKTPLTFDVSVWELFWPLSVGARLVLAEPEMHRDSRYIAGLIREREITTVHFVPSMLQPVVEEPAFPACRSLRRVICSGEALPAPLAARFLARSEAELHNLYGPTEASVDVSYWACRRSWTGASVPIGRPVANTIFAVADGEQREAPAGVPGELYLGGVQLARGYVGRPDLTAERFVPDGLTGLAGERLYRTGDLARWRPDGAVEYLGRIDQQVKIHGFRIELGEIEAVLAGHPDVREAAVAVVGEEGGRQLAGYVVPVEGRRLDLEALGSHLRRSLPEYMVPALWVELAALPLTASGKLDRRALPAPERRSGAGGAPSTPAERALARVWAEVLGVPEVGLHDGFFLLGGDSIQVLQAVRLAAGEGLRLTPRDFFRHPTLAELARAAAPLEAAPETGAGRPEGEVPLTPVQHWLLERRPADLHHFNQAVWLTVAPGLDPERLAGAWAEILERHDAFRLRFTPDPASPCGIRQAYAETAGPSPLGRLDLAALPAAARELARRGAAVQLQASLDLASGPLARAALLSGGPGGAPRLFLVAHHLVIDAVSWTVVAADLEAACRRPAGEPAPSPRPSASYQEWARRRADAAADPGLAGEAAGWLALSGEPVRPLPRDLPGDNPAGAERTLEVALDAAETRELLDAALPALQASLDEVLLTALARAFESWTGSPRLLIDLEGHGRESGELDVAGTVGWLTSVFPVCLAAEPGDEPAAPLRRTKERLRAAAGRAASWGLLRYLREETAEAFRALPRAEVLFNDLGRIGRGPAGSLLTLAEGAEGDAGPWRAARQDRGYLLEIGCRLIRGALRVAWSYGSRVHRPETVERLAAGFLAGLRGLIAAVRSPREALAPSDFPLARLTAEELGRVLRGRPVPEDLYALAPAQQGILFHTLESPEPGVYGQQIAWTVRGLFDEEAFAAAWRLLVAHRPVLRTGFVWGETEAPLQVAHREVGLPVARLDWRGLPAAEAQARLDAFLAEDRRRGFDPARPPLLRLAVIRLEDEVRRVVASLHHLILDGWSLGLAFGEAAALYEEIRRGGEARPVRSRPFRDFIAWLAAQDGAEAEAFWRRELTGFTEPTPVGGGARSAAAPWTEAGLKVPAAVWADRLAALRREGLTAGTLLQGAWALLLHRYGGGDDVVLGAVSAGRPATLAGSESMLGVFVATLPVRVRVRSAAPAAAWLRELQARQAEARLHEHAPLARIQAWSELAPGRQLFDSLLVVENYPLAGALAAAGVAPEEIAASERNHYPVTLSAFPLEGLELRLNGREDRFDAPAASRLLVHFDRLLAGLAEAPDRPLADLPLLTGPELLQVAREWSRGEDEPWPVHRLHDLLAEQARRTPQAVALSAEGEELTYGELVWRARALARRLAAAGAGPEERVGIFLDRSVEQILALLAVLESGAAYVPLEPSHPAERLRAVVEDAGLALVVSRESLAADLAAAGYAGRQVWVEADREGSLPPAPGDPAGRGLAYVLYTSGSTGRPKGVMVAHRSICNRVLWMRDAFALGPSDWVLYKTPFSFDASIWEIFAPWTAGGRVVVARPGGHQDPAYLAAAVREHGITTLQLVPSMLQALLEEPGLAGCGSLRRLFCGGEALPVSMVERLTALLPGVEAHNLYGPTEASIDVSHRPCPPGALPAAGVVPIGRPLPNVLLFVLDGEMRPVPPGVPGEVYAGGVGLARGYRRRADLTAARFVPDPLGGEPGGRLYATGDLGRWLPDGEIELLGRLDQQVKVRGVRVELGEVEAALLRHPAVREAAAAVRAGSGGLGGGRLAGYMVPREGSAIDREELRRFLAGLLPAAMVPSDLVVLSALPTLSNGKLDRARLPEPEAPAIPAEGRHLLTPTEELLAGIWCAALGRPWVSPDESFHEAGGHSLVALRVVSRVRETLRVELTLRDLFDAPSLAALAARVGELRAAAAPAAPPLVPRPAADAPALLSFAQQRMWLLHELDPRSASYNLPAVLRVRGPLDPALLARSLAAIVERHEVLRTAFLPGGGAPAQVVRPFAPPPLPLVDLSALSGATRETAAAALTAEEIRRPFDLATGQPLRALLLRLGADEHRLALTLHHIASDAWSAEILLCEAGALYGAFAAGHPSPLPPLPVQYADFALWQREWLQGEALAAELAFWRQRLAGAPPVLDLPTDRPRPAEVSDAGGRRRAALPAVLPPALARLARGAGATLFMTLLAAFQALLSRLSGQLDLTVGTPLAGRTRLETEGLIGFFVNTLVLRADLAGRPAAGELLARARESTLEAYAHQDLPFEKLVEELRPERSLGHTPLFQAVIVLQNANRSLADLARLSGREIELLPVETGTAKFDLTLQVEERKGGLETHLEFRRDLFDAATADRLLGCFRALLEGMAGDPGRAVEELPLLGAAERHQALVEWNAVERHERPVALHRLFEAQVAARPAAVALVCGEERMSYGDLDRRANRLARHLRSLGVGPEVRVALYLERSVDQVVAVLAVLKAGGAYVPLEPAYPAERLAFTLADSAARVLVTTAAAAAALPPHPALPLLLDRDAAAIAARSAEGLPDEVDAGSLAYVIYTSGSTGRAKGVLIPHLQVARLLAATERTFGFGPDDVWTLFHSYAFDFSVWEIWGALAYGGRLVVVPYLVSRSPEDFRELLRREGVTVLNQTPSAFRQLVALEGNGVPPLSGLRFVCFGGEGLDPAWLAPWVGRYGVERPRLVNLYGITETTVHVTERPLTEADVARAGASPIGRPIADLEAHLLDHRMEPVPLGAAGELYVGGAGLARGYLGRPELTAERFAPHPFATTPGARLYRSGDLARRLSDGGLEFLGRADHQVKIRGFRIELGEIEAALAAHPQVREAVVLLREQGGEKRLAAYLVLAAGADLADRELRDFLARRCPEPMLPSAFARLEALPLTGNGKLDRAALAALAVERRGSEGEHVAPRTAVEEVVAGVFAELLGVERVGLRDDFFALGGHSLLATQAVSRLQQVFRIKVPLRDFFGASTVESVAALLVAGEPAPGRLEKIAKLLRSIEAMPAEQLRAAARESRAGRTEA